MNHESIPVVSIDAAGQERPGVWFRVSRGPVRDHAGAVERPWRLNFVGLSGSTSGWVLETRIASLSHTVFEPGWEMMVPGSDRLPLLFRGQTMRLGGCLAGKVVEFVADPNGNVPPAALPAMMRVEKRMNKLLSEASNDEACITIQVSFIDLPEDEGLGDPPPGAIKGQTLRNDANWAYPGAQPRFGVRAALSTFHADTGDFADGDQAFYDQLPGDNVWARIGPLAPPPADVLTLDRVLVPIGLVSLWNNEPETAIVQIDTDPT